MRAISWPVKRAIVQFANQLGIEFIRSLELGSRRCFPDVNIQHQLEDRKRYNGAVLQLVPTLTSGTRVAAGKPGAISFGAL